MLYFLESVLLNNDLNNRFDTHLLTEATGVRKQLRSLSFLVCFQTCKYLYGYTNSMSQQLQGSTFQIARVQEIVAQLNDIRDDAASEYQNIFTKCQAIAALADTTITVPRIVTLQTLRDNIEHKNTEQYYRRMYSFRTQIALYNN